MKRRFLLRRTTALTLCAVLMLGMMVIPAAAAAGMYDPSKVQYLVEVVTGEDGYTGTGGRITLDYQESFQSEAVQAQTDVYFSLGYNMLHSEYELLSISSQYDASVSTPWLTTSAADMQSLGKGYTGNYYFLQNPQACLQPYTATTFLLDVGLLPVDILSVNSITVTLDDSDNMVIQSIRVIKVDQIDSSDYWNGCFSNERLRGYTGTLIAETKGNSYTVNGRSSITFEADQSYDYLGLTNYSSGSAPRIDSTGTAVGVSFQIADVLNAGIEAYLAWNGQEYSDKAAVFPASSQLEKQAGAEARRAWYNLYPFFQESMTLSIQYQDTLGALRQVDIPFATTYLLYILKENQGKLCTSSGSSTSTNLGGGLFAGINPFIDLAERLESAYTGKNWISGVFQQNENVALPLRLSEYQSLVSISFKYGTAPSGFISDNKMNPVLTSADNALTIENFCFYEGVTASNFTSKYDGNHMTCLFKTSLSPTCSYSSASRQGQQLSNGTSLNLSADSGALTPGAPRARDCSNQYLVELKTSTAENAGTTDPLYVTLNYVDTAGAARSTAAYSVVDLSAAYYGTSHRINGSYDAAPLTYQYGLHMQQGETCAFVVEIPDLASVTSVTLSLSGSGSAALDEWQMSDVTVKKVNSLDQRTGYRQKTTTLSGVTVYNVFWKRTDHSEVIGYASQITLLSTNNPSRIIYLTTYDEEGAPLVPEPGTKTDDYLVSLPESMTYSDTRKDLGLSIVKYTYQVDVQVADIQDAGSTNYFYFQLAFENGSSGVVLANQQLASDSFRQGMLESFQIKTTQNYGNIVAVRIICDNTSSGSNVFDKLNIEKITVTMRSDSGISKSWVVDRVGWIDITYVDEGAEAGIAGLNNLTGSTPSTADIVKEFAVTGQATAVDLLFCISTAASSANASSNPLENALGGKIEATLIYRDSSGMEQRMNFDLPSKIKVYNDTENTAWIFRPNHVDRFTLSIPDVSSIIALVITRTGGSGTWEVSNVSIQQIGGLSEVYLSPSLSEYYRDPTDAVDLAVSTNDQGVNYSIGGSKEARITFTENSIDISSLEEADGWSASISRVPVSTSESLNIYLLPGSVIGQNYTFTASSPTVRATVKYTTVYGGALVQNAFTLTDLGELNGQTVLYGKNLPVNAMSSLNSMVLSSTAASGDQPYISAAIVERSRGGVLVGTYYIDFGNAYLGNGAPPEHAPSTTYVPTEMHQILRLQPAAGQTVVLTAETSDIAVALRYTSTLDPAENKTVYQSPYVYFTDAGYSAVTTGHFLDIPFALGNVDEIVGLSIATTGPVVSFDNAIAYSCAGPAPLPGDTEDAASLLDVCSLSRSFTAGTLPAAYTENGQLVTPARFRFTTAPEEAAASAGTSGQVSMTVCYVDSTGAQRSMDFDNLLSYLPSDSSVVPGSTVEIPLQLSDAAYLDHIVLSAEDSWLLSSVSAELTPPGGAASLSSTSVNNWARSTLPLTVDLLPAAYGGAGEGNQIQTFTVTGRGQNAQIAASAAATSNTSGSLLVTAYEGDTVELTPVVTAVGEPDTTWTWNAGSYESCLTIRSDNSAWFRVPGSMTPGSSCTFSVACNGDRRLTVSVTIAVEEKPAEQEPDWGLQEDEGEIGSESAE